MSAHALLTDVHEAQADWTVADTIQFTGKYSFADSGADVRGAGGFSLNTMNRIRSQAQTTTGTFAWTASPNIVVDLRANYSRLRVAGSQALDSFGGAVVPSDLVPSVDESFNFDLNARGANLMIGSDVANIQRQFNTVGAMHAVFGNHSFRFGADYRRMSPQLGFRARETNVLFDGIDQAMTGVPSRTSSRAGAAVRCRERPRARAR